MCYHTVKWVYFEGIKLTFVVFALPRTLIILEFEFAQSLQHMSKSVERYAFLIWILCTQFYHR